ncbi:MAG: fibronectin type III-like domain-contianing protein, partial [Clostridia bacterium]|nr:fibronectin type III-like domain-contianing protein [Clostridia bacterium]
RAKTIYDSLTEAGYDCNPVLKEFYENSSKSGKGRNGEASIEAEANFGVITGETPYDKYTSDVVESYSDYSDMALIVISRTSGEGNDMPRTMRTGADEGSSAVDGAFSKDDHYLELDKNEQELIRQVCDAGFERVVLILNTSTSMELGFLDGIDDRDSTSILAGYDTAIGAALVIGFPGDNGIMALGRILNGNVNPSGRTVDLYARDFTEDPTYYNFGHNNSDKGNQYLIEGKREGRNGSGEYFVEYEEGIYYGYRYYETRAAELEKASEGKGEAWYTDHVVYPFGYGLSYTDFSWQVIPSLLPGEIQEDGTLTFQVTVTNEGTVAGKDVVEVYYTAPYYAGQIEKAHRVLAGFAKTGLIAPGESDTVSVSFPVRDMASYDAFDDNDNGFMGYEMDAGTYTVSVARHSHDTVAAFDYEVTEGIQYPVNALGNSVVNRFDDVSRHFLTEDGTKTTLTRADFGTDEILSFPTTPTKEERTVSQDFINTITHLYSTSDPSDPWYVSGAVPASGVTLTDPILFHEMRLIPYGDEVITSEQSERFAGRTGDEVWQEFVSQLTLDEIRTFVGTSSYSTPALTSIQKPGTIDSDGPLGWVNFMAYANNTISSVCSYASEPVLAATYNVELARRMGEAVGDEALVGYTTSEGVHQPYSGWFAPGVNIHRSPFGGRNFEYYSEDPHLLGKMAAQVIQGAKSKGVYTQLKHFAANDQETNRSGVCTWVDEQTFREVYLRPFEIAITEGGSLGLMSSFNRIGSVWTGGSYALLTEVLRGEWDF